MTLPYRLSIVTSHPIQYQAPLFRALAARPEIDLTVYFCSDMGLKPYTDPGFGTRFSWDVPLLGGYRHDFLRNLSPAPARGGFWRALNPGALRPFLPHAADAVMVHGWALATNWLTFAAGISTRVPLLLRGETTGLSEPPGVRGAVKRALLGSLFGRISGFLAIGSLNRAFYESYQVPSDRIYLAPYSVDNDRFQGLAQDLLPRRAILRQEQRIPEDATVFLFCGKLSQVKRPLDLLEAFAGMPSRQSCYLVYVGDGALRGEIESRATDMGLHNVRVTGFQNQSELPKWYALGDVLVLPSDFEPWGLVVNEAMNFGLPAIVSDQVGAAPDLVLNDATGLVFPAGDMASLSRSLQILAESPRLRAAMSERARDCIRQWGIRETVEGILLALEQGPPVKG